MQCAKMEKRDGIVDMCKVGPKSDACAVLFPLDPVGSVQFCITRRNSRFHCCPDSTVANVHLSANVRRAYCHKFCCGYYLVLKKESRELGVGWRMREALSASLLRGPGT